MNKILVTGASGQIGRKTLQSLLKRVPADQLVGLVRDPAKAEDLAAQGIELRQGDYLDTDSLTRAFSGIDKLMLTSAQAFTDRKTAHANAIEAATKAGIGHVVYMPIIRKAGSGLSIKEVTDEDRFTEEKLRTSGLAYTLAGHPPFLDVLDFYLGPNAAETGVRVPSGNGKFAVASRTDLADAHATLLTEEGYEGRRYVLTGDPAVSFADVAAILSQLLDRTVPYTAISDAEYVAAKQSEGYPDFVADFALQWARGMTAGEWDHPTGDLETLIGRKPRSVTEYLSDDYLQPGSGQAE